MGYFTSLILKRVTRVTAGNKSSNPSLSEGSKASHSVTPPALGTGNTGNKTLDLFPVVTHPKTSQGTLEPHETAAVTPVPCVTSQKNKKVFLTSFYEDFYDERTALRPWKGRLQQEDAEGQARNDTVIYFLENTGYDPGDGAVNRFIKAFYNRPLTFHNPEEK